jgi:hypothetical protein
MCQDEIIRSEQEVFELAREYFGLRLTDSNDDTTDSEGEDSVELTNEEYRRGLVADAFNESFTQKRHDQRVKTEGKRPKEMAWKEPSRERAEERRQERLWERLHWHEQMIRAHDATHQAIVARHRGEVERLERELGITSEATQKGAA